VLWLGGWGEAATAKKARGYVRMMRAISHGYDEFESLGRESDSVLVGWVAMVLKRLARSIHILADKCWNSPIKALNFRLPSWSCEEHQYENVLQESLS
jgi:hypothetical protein